MILVGYISIFLYIFFLIFALGPLIQKRSNLETSRKVIHILLFGVWVMLDAFLRGTIHMILIPVTFIILNLLSRKFNIYRSVERQGENHMGTVYFAIAVTAVMIAAYCFPKMYYESGVAVFCLTFGDGFAALVGYNTHSRPIRENKTLNGFLSCFLASTVAIFVFGLIYCPELSLGISICLGIMTAILELANYGLDNYTVTLGMFVVSYYLLHHPNTLIGVVIAEMIFLIVFFSHAIDYCGSLLSIVVVYTFYYCGGITGLSILLLEYFSIFCIGLYKKHNTSGKKTHSPRNLRQIAINGGLATIIMILYRIFDQPRLFIIALIAVSGCFVDSVASDVGTLSKKPPFDFIKGKVVSAGISGGITLLGTAAALTASISLALILSHYTALSNSFLFVMLVMGQMFLDSVLGSTLQVKYFCNTCGLVTEKKECCGAPTVYYSGLNWFDNNLVNLFSSTITVTIAFLVIGW